MLAQTKLRIAFIFVTIKLPQCFVYKNYSIWDATRHKFLYIWLQSFISYSKRIFFYLHECYFIIFMNILP